MVLQNDGLGDVTKGGTTVQHVAVVAKCVSWIYLALRTFCEKSKSARKGNDDKKSHPPKEPGACRVLLAGVSFLKVIGAACFDLQILSAQG